MPSSKPTTANQGHPATTDDPRPRLAIIYETTGDNLDGSPWPPDGSEFWCVVKRADGLTTWRRIALLTN